MKIYVFLNDIPAGGAVNTREAWMPKGGGYFDKSARRYFNTKREKRAWLTREGMRECGELFNPDKALGGTEGAMTRGKHMQSGGR